MSDIRAKPFALCSDSKSKTPRSAGAPRILTPTMPLSPMRFSSPLDARWLPISVADSRDLLPLRVVIDRPEPAALVDSNPTRRILSASQLVRGTVRSLFALLSMSDTQHPLGAAWYGRQRDGGISKFSIGTANTRC
jgi:hypothetical protein